MSAKHSTKRKTPTCGHPDKRHKGHGLCTECYNRRRKEAGVTREVSRRWRLRNLEKVKAYAKARSREKYASEEGRRKLRDWLLRKNFGIGLEEYEAMHAEQGGVCAICRMAETTRRKGVLRRLSVDHCHETGKVRGLLCEYCNQMIGRARENTETLKAAIVYLEQGGTMSIEPSP